MRTNNNHQLLRKYDACDYKTVTEVYYKYDQSMQKKKSWGWRQRAADHRRQGCEHSMKWLQYCNPPCCETERWRQVLSVRVHLFTCQTLIPTWAHSSSIMVMPLGLAGWCTCIWCMPSLPTHLWINIVRPLLILVSHPPLARYVSVILICMSMWNYWVYCKAAKIWTFPKTSERSPHRCYISGLYVNWMEFTINGIFV